MTPLLTTMLILILLMSLYQFINIFRTNRIFKKLDPSRDVITVYLSYEAKDSKISLINFKSSRIGIYYINYNYSFFKVMLNIGPSFRLSKTDSSSIMSFEAYEAFKVATDNKFKIVALPLDAAVATY